MRVLRDFMNALEFVRMKPDSASVKSLPEGVRARVLSEPGRQYGLYLFGQGTGNVALDLPRGLYDAQWTNTLDGKVVAKQALDHAGGDAALEVPPHGEDIALTINRR
jgi:hypothetical protein